MSKCYICGAAGPETCATCNTLKQIFERVAKEKGWELEDDALRMFIVAYTLGEKDGRLVQCGQCEQDFTIDEESVKDGEHWYCDDKCKQQFQQEVDAECYDEDYQMVFADPGGESALRAATSSNPRNLPCPSCGEANRLTPIDRARGYQCDSCANAAERG